MKFLTYLLFTIAVLLIIYNATIIDADNLFEGDSSIAIIGILASGCVILLLLILKISKKIAKKKQR